MIVVNGIRTHYARLPARSPARETPPTVVFVHGLGYDNLASFYLTLAAPVCAAGLDVLTYDLRAHGRSERPATGYLLGDFVTDLKELLDAVGIAAPVHLVGNSFGGAIAFSFAASYPERVLSIVSIEAEPPTASWAEKMSRAMTHVVEVMSDEETLRWLAENHGDHTARLTRVAVAMIKATSIMTDLPRGPLLDDADLAAIRCPVLSIVGSEGMQRDDLTALQSALPNCRTEIIDGQDHSVLVERHHTVRELLLDWVAEHDPVDVADTGAA